jgi:hypothetical protein
MPKKHLYTPHDFGVLGEKGEASIPLAVKLAFVLPVKYHSSGV